jgi:hypothetical protein
VREWRERKERACTLLTEVGDSWVAGLHLVRDTQDGCDLYERGWYDLTVEDGLAKVACGLGAEDPPSDGGGGGGGGGGVGGRHPAASPGGGRHAPRLVLGLLAPRLVERNYAKSAGPDTLAKRNLVNRLREVERKGKDTHLGSAVGRHHQQPRQREAPSSGGGCCCSEQEGKGKAVGGSGSGRARQRKRRRKHPPLFGNNSLARPGQQYGSSSRDCRRRKNTDDQTQETLRRLLFKFRPPTGCYSSFVELFSRLLLSFFLS